MYENRFSAWLAWYDRESALNISRPGVYVLAYSTPNIAGKHFSWLRGIIYIGMTNASTGLRGRLRQFDRTLLGKTGHGGADRVLFKHQNYDELVQNLYLAMAPFKFDSKSDKPKDLIKKGEVAKFEYLCFAQYAEKHGMLPEFNRMTSQKYSKQKL